MKVTGVGDSKINSSIGAQWKYQIDYIDEQIRNIAESMTENEKQTTYLHVKLEY